MCMVTDVNVLKNLENLCFESVLFCWYVVIDFMAAKWGKSIHVSYFFLEGYAKVTKNGFKSQVSLKRSFMALYRYERFYTRKKYRWRTRTTKNIGVWTQSIFRPMWSWQRWDNEPPHKITIKSKKYDTCGDNIREHSKIPHLGGKNNNSKKIIVWSVISLVVTL